MEFSPRGFQRNNTPRQPSNTSVNNGGGDSESPTPHKDSSLKSKVNKLKEGRFPGVLSIVLFVSLVVLVITIILGISSYSNREIRAVDKENYQAVVLSDGQAYFGKITRFNTDYLILIDVFYVQGQQLGQNQNQQSASLRKLGCEIHGPQDHMIIYRSQVMYWENLKHDGRVPQLIEQFKEENPDGQTCSTQTPSGGSQDNGQSENNQSTEENTNGDNSQNRNGEDNETPTPPPAGNPDESTSDLES